MKRRDDEQPSVVSRRGWKYHHVGIPTSVPRPGERHLTYFKLHVAGFDTSPYGVEWMRFDQACQVHHLVRSLPHVAFEVPDIEKALKGCTVLSDISSPSPGVRVAMIVDDGAPIELIEFSKRKRVVRAKPPRARGHFTPRSNRQARHSSSIEKNDG
jgi:hypothetical protein